MCKTNTSLARVEKYSAVDEALNLIYLYIQEVYSPKEVELICGELKSIARRDDFQCVEVASSKRTYTQVQDALSKINEKQSIRKSKGVYYTPNDVVRFILTNSIKASFGKLTASNVSDLNMDNIPYRSFCCRKTGTSKTFESKKFVLKQLNPESDALAARFVSQESISAALDEYKLNESDYADPSSSSKLLTGGWDLVQFHPSYGYEDFIRGIEVKADGGLPSYNSVNRILGKIAEFATIAEKANPDEPPKFYLVIDEINRANIATVFGELIYGLEYRDSKVSTPYEVEDKVSTPVSRTKDIVLGKNLFIIGTMNTADKSIDSIDYAIRRRFLFVDSPADRNVVINCYQNASENDDENSIELLVFDAVQAIFDNESYFNDEYQKSDVRLGHTYFLRKRKEGYEEDFVERFVFQIIPILREYVKDGILDTIEDLIAIEHTPSEIRDATDRSERVRFISDNIMLYAKEFGNTTRAGKRIDNEYVGTFVEEVRTKIGY